MVRRADGIYSETRQSLPGRGGVTSLAPIAVGLLVLRVRQAREAARDAQSMNNLRQIGLAMHNFHDTYGALPAPANYDADGKPAPELARAHPALHRARHAVQEIQARRTWDSKHNKALIKEMPSIYKVVGGMKVDDGKTCYWCRPATTRLFPKARRVAQRD